MPDRFHVLFENNPHPTWLYDTESLRFLEVNRAAVERYGYSREEFLSMRITDIRPEEDVDPLLEELKQQRPAHKSSERRYRTRNGEIFPVEVTSNLAELNGRQVAVVVAEDLTQRKLAQAILLRSKEDAEQATRFKDQFLSTMSHELRTPLNAILGFSDLICDERYGPLNARQRRYIQYINTSGRHLLRLINDILDLSKIQAGHFELALEAVQVSEIFGEVISALRPLAEEKNQALYQSADRLLCVRADVTRLKQVLFNLGGNAIKFTPHGGKIRLSASEQNGRVKIEVTDDGRGIPLEEQHRVFEPFHLLREPGEVKEGTGLGLAISQRLVQLHGSELELQSEPGHGSCFYFSLPAVGDESVRANSGQEANPKTKDAPLVLIVEDDPVTLQLISLQLSSSGYEVVGCQDGRKACDLAADLQPDAITLDLFMKPMNGWEVLVQLKGSPRTEKIPVVVLTIVDQPAMGAILGADEYLVKPVEKTALLQALQRCMKSRGVDSADRTVLVVEDDPAIREAVSEFLRSSGYDVRTAGDGLEARAAVDAALPGFVVLDLLLPSVTGFELIAEWRSRPRTADLPVLVLTARDLNLDERNYLRTNAEGLVRKQEDWQTALLRQLQRTAPVQQVQIL